MMIKLIIIALIIIKAVKSIKRRVRARHLPPPRTRANVSSMILNTDKGLDLVMSTLRK